MLRAHVELTESIPHGGDLLHDTEGGDVPIVWVTRGHLTAFEAQRFEERINAAAHAKGRHLTTREILQMVPLSV